MAVILQCTGKHDVDINTISNHFALVHVFGKNFNTGISLNLCTLNVSSN